MVCCALAALLIGNILLLWGRVRSWLHGGAADRTVSAAAWTPGSSGRRASSRSRVRTRSGLVLAGLGLAGFAGAAVAASQPGTVELGDTGIYAPVCGDIAGPFDSSTPFWSE